MNRRTLATWALLGACAMALDAVAARAQKRGRSNERTSNQPGRHANETYPVVPRYPATLPEIGWGVVFGRGDRQAVAEARGWLGGGDVRPRYTDADHDGRPEVVGWYDAHGMIVQLWIDDNRDGRADRVAIHRNGRVVQVLR